jgi:hypothetical protein
MLCKKSKVKQEHRKWMGESARASFSRGEQRAVPLEHTIRQYKKKGATVQKMDIFLPLKNRPLYTKRNCFPLRLLLPGCDFQRSLLEMKQVCSKTIFSIYASPRKSQSHLLA